MLLIQKWPFFQLFFLGNISKENFFYDILERENAFLGYKNKNFKQSKNWHFSKCVNPWFWSKNSHFSIFFLVNIGQENVFYDILQRKHAFLGYKNKMFKKSKNWHFYKEVNPWFRSKNGDFSILFFSQYRTGKMSFTIFKNEKNAFLGYKNKKFKKPKNGHFVKGVNAWFWSKNDHFFSKFFFWQYNPGICLLLSSSRKKRLPRL